jgi:hypothetical protein
MRRAIVAAIVLTFALVAPVAAAPPTNDSVGGALDLPLGATVTQSTLEATTDAFELSLNAPCGAPAVGGAVWFRHVASADGFVAIDVSDSNFSAGTIVTTPVPTPDNVIACGPGRIVFDVEQGETYWIMAFGDGLSPNTTGNLVITAEAAAPPPEIELTVNSAGTVDRNGVVHLTGTVTCTSEDDAPGFIDLFGEMTQRVGRLLIRGSFGTFLETTCDGSSQVWDAFFVGDNGIFAGGKAATIAIAFGCTDLCSETYVEATVQLRRSGKSVL